MRGKSILSNYKEANDGKLEMYEMRNINMEQQQTPGGGLRKRRRPPVVGGE
jgi:hypothetical protein